MEKKPLTVYRFLRRMLIWPVLALWLLSMVLLTFATAGDFYSQLKGQAKQVAASIVTMTDDGTAESRIRSLGAPYVMLEADALLPILLPQTPDSYGTDDWFWGKWELLFGYQAAVAFCDSNADPIMTSGDYLVFSYAQAPGGTPVDSAYVDLERLPGGKAFAGQYISSYPAGDHFAILSYSLKLTGYPGSQGDFLPTGIYMALDTGIATEYKLIYENPEAIRDGEPPVTIYADDVFGHNYSPGGAIPVKRYYGDDTVPDQTGDRSILNSGYMYIEDAILTDNYGTDFGWFNAHIAATEFYENGDSVRLFIYCSPLEYAALRLLPTYLVSLLLVSVTLWLCLRAVKKKLTDPLAVVIRAYEQDRAELSAYADSPLAELRLLNRHFDRAQQDRHTARNQVTRLETALSYANTAEDNRRKLVSAIAHELKTPLAVIHSYAECLRDGIAADQKDRYLSVILDESEKIDGLVGQMLDLSRLEAGKVRLSADSFDLTELTGEVFQKLSLAAARRSLEITLPERPVTVTADRARLEQVVTNFASNAVKYSPDGGKILVALAEGADWVRFTIENESPPLSAEALERVWDSFYRADTARDRSGTGLGLAIAKNILTLHRGSCQVRNTKTGVEFAFTLPK